MLITHKGTLFLSLTLFPLHLSLHLCHFPLSDIRGRPAGDNEQSILLGLVNNIQIGSHAIHSEDSDQVTFKHALRCKCLKGL